MRDEYLQKVLAGEEFLLFDGGMGTMLQKRGLTPGELAVYSYLMRCEDRATHQCHPSYATIGRAVNLSKNTVRKYVQGLCEKRLITTEPTTVVARGGEKRNGTLFPEVDDATFFVRGNDSMHPEKYVVRPLPDKKLQEAKRVCTVLH